MTDRHILVVDDDPGIRFALALKLRSAGFSVAEAVDGQAALDALQQRPADLVVLDVGMPRLDGYATARRMHADAALRAVPVVFLTAQDLGVPAALLPDLGVHRFLTKPFSPREVLRTVNELLPER